MSKTYSETSCTKNQHTCAEQKSKTTTSQSIPQSNKVVLQKKSHHQHLVDWILVVLFFLQLIGLLLPSITHRVFGVLFCIFLGAHLIQHKKWFAALPKGRYTQKRKKKTALNLLLALSIIVLAISGFFVPGTTHTFLQVGIYTIPGIVHIGAITASVLLLYIHVANRIPKGKRILH